MGPCRHNVLCAGSHISVIRLMRIKYVPTKAEESVPLRTNSDLGSFGRAHHAT